MEISDEEDLGGLVREGYYDPSALFTPMPVQVFSAHILPTSLNAHFIQPPTPFPTNPITQEPSPALTDKMHLDSPVKPAIAIKVKDTTPNVK